MNTPLDRLLYADCWQAYAVIVERSSLGPRKLVGSWERGWKKVQKSPSVLLIMCLLRLNIGKLLHGAVVLLGVWNWVDLMTNPRLGTAGDQAMSLGIISSSFVWRWATLQAIGWTWRRLLCQSFFFTIKLGQLEANFGSGSPDLI